MPDWTKAEKESCRALCEDLGVKPCVDRGDEEPCPACTENSEFNSPINPLNDEGPEF